MSVVRFLLAGGLSMTVACSRQPDGVRPSSTGEASAPAPVPAGPGDAGANMMVMDAARASEPSADTTDAGPRRLSQPFEGLPPPSRELREVIVRFEVARRVRKEDGPTSPLLLLIPAMRVEREIYDDRVSRPRCRFEENALVNAVTFVCTSVDGRVQGRAWQDGPELVVDVEGRADVAPTLLGLHRFALPPRTRVKFEMRLPAGLPEQNGGSGP